MHPIFPVTGLGTASLLPLALGLGQSEGPVETPELAVAFTMSSSPFLLSNHRLLSHSRRKISSCLVMFLPETRNTK